ncbi:MAG: heparinase II/III family protein, partial [Alphaproteobacteria bacterium]|nr:heparinase II/III family protein [Alphaproteobacteria bacterium]
MLQAPNLILQVRKKIQNVTYSNPLYKKLLELGSVPEELVFTHADPWVGDVSAGEALLSAQASMFTPAEDTTLQNSEALLRNLRSVGSLDARKMSVFLINNWIEQYDSWDDNEWTAKNLGARIAAWIGFYDFYSPAASYQFRAQLIASLHKQWKHLERIASVSLRGLDGIQTARGLIYGALNFAQDDRAIGLACDLIQRSLADEILPDGGLKARNPSLQLHILKHLISMKELLDTLDIEAPLNLRTHIAALATALRFFKHGDGKLALFNGSHEESADLIDAVLRSAGSKGRILPSLHSTQFERFSAGKSLLLVDAGVPPDILYNKNSHAGLSSFEFSFAKDRIITNCGATPNNSLEWAVACASTAAHSTLTVENTNACPIDKHGHIYNPPQASYMRFDEDGMTGINIAHNGYKANFGLVYKRRLKLSDDGALLSGKEVLFG